jgi:hypothetical protein
MCCSAPCTIPFTYLHGPGPDAPTRFLAFTSSAPGGDGLGQGPTDGRPPRAARKGGPPGGPASTSGIRAGEPYPESSAFYRSLPAESSAGSPRREQLDNNQEIIAQLQQMNQQLMIQLAAAGQLITAALGAADRRDPAP